MYDEHVLCTDQFHKIRSNYMFCACSLCISMQLFMFAENKTKTKMKDDETNEKKN